MNIQFNSFKNKKLFTYSFNLFLITIILLSSLLFVGCNNTNSDSYKTIVFSSTPYILEATVTNIDTGNDNIYSKFLDVEIQIKNLTDKIYTAHRLDFHDFKFYLTKHTTVYKTYMYTDSRRQQIDYLSLKSQTTTKIHLCIYFDIKDNITNEFKIYLWNKQLY